MSYQNLLKVLGFKPHEVPDEEGNKSVYHLILDFIWVKVRKNLVYFNLVDFRNFQYPEDEIQDILTRLLDLEILKTTYRIDCPECDFPYEETDNPIPIWGSVYTCPSCKSNNQIFGENILCYYKFNSKDFKESFSNFFFRNILQKNNLQIQIL